MVTEGILISSIASNIFSELVSKAFSDGVDISKNAIRNVYQERKSYRENLQSEIYHVIEKSLNKFTGNKYKRQDKLQDATESVLKGLKSGKNDVDAVKEGLKMLIPGVDTDICVNYLEVICREICKNENNVLYKEIDILWKKRSGEYLRSGFEENNRSHEETHRQLNTVIEQLGCCKRDQDNENILMLRDNEREFVVTHNVCVKPVSYFTGREREIEELCRRIDGGCKAILVSGMGGIGKSSICKRLFEIYLDRHAEDVRGYFRHIGYIVYSGNMVESLQRCLVYKKQDRAGQNEEAVWRELEYLASDGKLLLFVDNVNSTVNGDPGLQRLRSIPAVVVMTSRLTSMGEEFETYNVELLEQEQCKEIFEKIRFRNRKGMLKTEDIPDLESIIENVAGRHTITVENLAYLARTKSWSIKRLRDELEQKGFQLTYHKEGEDINIQKLYEALYDLSDLSEAEQNILEAFSLFPYIPLPVDLCNRWLLGDAGVEEDDDILMGLYDKGWLQFDIEAECYVMHPVFAQFISERCKPKEEKHLSLIEACMQSMQVNEIGQDIIFYCPFALGIANKLQPARATRLAELLRIMIALAQNAKSVLEGTIRETENMLVDQKLIMEGMTVIGEIIEKIKWLLTEFTVLSNDMINNPHGVDVEKIEAFLEVMLNMDKLKYKFDSVKKTINEMKFEALSPELQEMKEMKEFINSAEIENIVSSLDFDKWKEMRDFLLILLAEKQRLN